MKDSRRSFIKKSTTLASALTAGGWIGGGGRLRAQSSQNANFPATLAGRIPVGPEHNAGASGIDRSLDRSLVRDAGMQMSEAYFDGFNQHKIALCKQMDVLGAVAGINPKMIGLNDAKPWDLPVIQAVKNAWDNEGLTLRVIEGPPALGEKTKLGLEGRDEEISNFITFMHNIAKVGIDTI